MDEQQLFTVNVWTQGLNDGKKRPVMFWLHGGGFRVGASDDPITHGKNLAKKGDIVLVSVNHRLNVLGYLRSEERRVGKAGRAGGGQGPSRQNKGRSA